MAEDDKESEEPIDAETGSQKERQVKGTRQSFLNVRRPFTEEELSQSGTQKMLLDDLDRLESELSDARDYQSRYYDESEKVAVFQEKFKTHAAMELLSTGAVTVGSLLCGGTFGSLLTDDAQIGLFALGIVLALVGLVAKAIKL
jgi:hypothetical protein